MLAFLLQGCLGNDALRNGAVADANVLNLSKLCIGMSECEVRSIMKEPYNQEHFAIDDANFNVWFYITSPTVLGQTEMVTANLTPLTFKDGCLISWGSSAYRYLVQRKNNSKTVATAPSKNAPTQPAGQPQSTPSGPNWGPVTPQPHGQGKQPQEQPQQEPTPPQQQPQKPPSPQQPKPPTQTPPPAQTPPKPAPQPPQKTLTPLAQGASDTSCDTSGNNKNPTQSAQSDSSEPQGTQPPTNQPLDEEDRKMLQESSDQEFNQTDLK